MFLKCFQIPKPTVLVDEGILIAAAFLGGVNDKTVSRVVVKQ